MYNSKVMSNFKNPNNAGTIPHASGIGIVGNSSCGDLMKLFLKVDENEIISEAKFKTFGCAAAIASTNVVCDIIKGKTVSQALQTKNDEIINELGGLPNAKVHCSILAEQAIHSAVEDYYKKKAKEEEKNNKNLL